MSKWGRSKYLKAITAMMLTASVVVVVAPIASEASSFKDVQQTHPYYDEIQNLNDRGIINGFQDGTFKPAQNLTRGQAAKIIAGVLGLDTSNVNNPNFKDIPTTHQYFGAIAALKQEGIIDGYDDGTFRQGDFIQRNHIAKMLANAFKLKASNSNALPFTDVHADYKEAIAALYENNVTTGKTASLFDGFSNVTRGQMAAFITRSEAVGNQTTQSITFKVEGYTANEIAINGKTYLLDESVKSIFTAENKTALMGADITASIKNGVLTKVKSVVFNKAGSAEKEVVFNSIATLDSLTINADFVIVKNVSITGDATITSTVKTKVEFDGATITGDLILADTSDGAIASLENQFASNSQSTPVLKLHNSRIGNVHIKRNNMSIVTDTVIPEIIIAATVSAINIDGAATKVTIETTAKLNMTGNVKFERLSLPTAVELALNTVGVVNSLTVLNGDARMTIGTGLLINELSIPAGSSVTKIITNYALVASQIKAIIGGSLPNPGVPNPGIPNPGGDNVAPDPIIPPDKVNEFNVKNTGELMEALKKAKAGDLIKFTAPMTTDVTLTDLIMIDLNGHTLKGNVTIKTPTASGKYTLIPSGSTGAISGDLIIDAPHVRVSLDGLTVEGNTIIE